VVEGSLVLEFSKDDIPFLDFDELSNGIQNGTSITSSVAVNMSGVIGIL
jgi:hypothetical protein